MNEIKCQLCLDTKSVYMTDKNKAMHELACPECFAYILPSGNIMIHNPENYFLPKKIGSVDELINSITIEI